MGGARIRKLGYDRTSFNNELKEKQDEISETYDLGERFEKSKSKLEAKMEEIENSDDISTSDKRNILKAMRNTLEKLETEYEEEVVEVIEELVEDFELILEDLQETADALKHKSESLKEVQLDAGSGDLSEASSTAEKEQIEFLRIKTSKKQEIELQMQRIQMQQRQMRVKKLSGR